MATNKEIVDIAYASLARTSVLRQCSTVLMRLGEIGDDFAVVPEQFVAEGDTVVVLGSYRWKHKGSGEPAVVKMVHVWTVDGGKAVAFQQHVDTLRVRELR